MASHGDKRHNAVPPNDTNIGTLPAVAGAAAPSYSEGNQVGLSVDLAGNLRTKPGIPSSSQLLSSVINFSASSDNTIIGGQASQTIRIFRIIFTVSANTNITFKDGTTGLTGALTFYAGGLLVLDFSGDPWFTTGAGNAFVINQSGSAQISGKCDYTQS